MLYLPCPSLAVEKPQEFPFFVGGQTTANTRAAHNGVTQFLKLPLCCTQYIGVILELAFWDGGNARYGSETSLVKDKEEGRLFY